MSRPGVRQPVYPGTLNTGMPFKACVVQSVQQGVALVMDQFQEQLRVSCVQMSAKGLSPQPGERWMLDRQYDSWQFALLLQAAPSAPLLDDQLAALRGAAFGSPERTMVAPLAIVGLASDATLANGLDVQLGSLWDEQALRDTDGMWQTDPVRTLTVPVTGYYDISLHATIGFNATGVRACKIHRNGTAVDAATVIGSDVRASTASGEGTVLDARCRSELLTAGDKLYFSVYQNSGVSLTLLQRGISGRTAAVVSYLGPPAAAA